jgi:hypothetical protein
MSLPKMGSAPGETSTRLAELEAVLVPLVPALERLHSAQLEQRRVVVAGDLSAMLAVNATIEETSARIAVLEQRRQSVQAELEAELDVQGLRAVLMVAAVVPTDRARLGQLLVQVSRLVRELREHGRRNADLLDAAIDAARRTRQTLERLSGVDNTYDTVKARRLQAARRVRASLTETMPPALTGELPGQPGEDEASSAPDLAPSREAL